MAMPALAAAVVAAALEPLLEALPDGLPEGLPVAEALGDADELLEALTCEVTFFDPQTTDWQMAWPLRSSGWSAVHWATAYWHSSDGSVCSKSDTLKLGMAGSHVQLYLRVF